MQKYSPFIDKNGTQIELVKLRFKDISNLFSNEVEEGYKVEFKSIWDDNFKKKHLCKTITSFANSEGGWLIVGLDDTGKYIGIDKERTDFSQTISQKLNSVTPIPKFDCRFIHETNNKKRGVLVIYVYEGINPPYVCDGTIYIRSGSSKTPIKSERAQIDELIHKRDIYKDQLNKFCFNNYVSPDVKFPYCTIYLFNPYNEIDYSNYNNNRDEIFKTLSDDNLRVTERIDSIIRVGSKNIGARSFSSIEEYYINGNIKIYTPLFLLNNNGEISKWINYVASYNSNVDLSNMKIIDGIINLLSINRFLITAFEYIKKSNYHVSDYKIVFEYKNMNNVVFFHKIDFKVPDVKEKLIEDIKSGEFYVSYYDSLLTEEISFIREAEKDSVESLSFQLLEGLYLKMFGIDKNNFIKIQKMCQGKYEQPSFSSDLYTL